MRANLALAGFLIFSGTAFGMEPTYMELTSIDAKTRMPGGSHVLQYRASLDIAGKLKSLEYQLNKREWVDLLKEDHTDDLAQYKNIALQELNFYVEDDIVRRDKTVSVSFSFPAPQPSQECAKNEREFVLVDTFPSGGLFIRRTCVVQY